MVCVGVLCVHVCRHRASVGQGDVGCITSLVCAMRAVNPASECQENKFDGEGIDMMICDACTYASTMCVGAAHFSV